MSTEIKEKPEWIEVVTLNRFDKGKGWTKRLRVVYERRGGSVLLSAESPDGRLTFGLADEEVAMLSMLLEVLYREKVYRKIEGVEGR